jgi:23S rRNA (guanosine2251-2'-O)-methyltransferase
MTELKSSDQNFIKTLITNLPEKVKEFVLPDKKNDKKTSDLIYLAKQNNVEVKFSSSKKLHATYEPAQAKDINFLEQLLDKKNNSLILILDHVMDPQNLGSILRTSLAAEVDAVVVSKNRACHLTDTVRKVSKGASEIIPFVIVNNIKYLTKHLKNINFKFVGCEASAEKKYYDFDYKVPVAIIMGSEGYGIKLNLKKEIDEMLKIPMSEKIESLNVSNACSVILFEANKQRN